ncbi:MAG: oxygen-dependent coproporphyrinogen oxidase [Rickettsiaceae bacterium H1]|nr:oxygen-dependent coproporphyrinogen oxidase [Rickettsiaceae bacterium H1]
MGNSTSRQLEIANNWFRKTRDTICSSIIELEKEYDKNANYTFHRSNWQREGGGGGEMSMLYGKVFEKVGVNISTVHGTFSDEFKKEIPGAIKSDGKFCASGISLVAHMSSPLLPAVHLNTRYISTAKFWFGGGTDLTPTYYNEQDKEFFHSKLKEICTGYDYNKFKKNADEYFYLKHRKESRGLGGIFYDYLNSNNWDKDFNFTQKVGKSFIEAYLPIVRQLMFEKYSEEQREYQLYKRGRYVEFNFLYDRGTRFGLMTGGNPNAILMSMPPQVKWDAGETLG